MGSFFSAAFGFGMSSSLLLFFASQLESDLPFAATELSLEIFCCVDLAAFRGAGDTVADGDIGGCL